MGRAVKVFMLIALAAAALLAYACGKSHVAGRTALQPGNSPQSFGDAQAQLDALACPDGVDAALWAQLKTAMSEALECRARTNDSGAAVGSAAVSAVIQKDGGRDTRPIKLTSSPPSGEANRVNDLAIADNGDGTYTLSWHYRNLGDYDQNGTVAVEDIIPIVQYFGETWVVDEEDTMTSVIDGSADGRVGIEDVTPVAINLGANVDHYVIEAADLIDGPWIVVANINRGVNLNTKRVSYKYILSGITSQYYRVNVFDNEGASLSYSNIAQFPTSPPAPSEWIHTWGGIREDTAESLALDAKGNVYIAGITTSFGLGHEHSLQLMYSPSGKLLRQRQWARYDTFHDGASAIVVDKAGNACVTGYTEDYDKGYDQTYLLRFDTTGEMKWGKTWGSNDIVHFPYTERMAMDSSGNIYVAGYEFGWGQGNVDALLLKYSPEGDVLWQRTWGGSECEYAWDIALGIDDCIYVAGETWGYGYGDAAVIVLKYSGAGQLLWQKKWNYSIYGQDAACAAVVDCNGDLYVAGHSELIETDNYDALLLKYSSDGNLLWQRIWGGYDAEGINDLAVDKEGAVYCVGFTKSYGAGGKDVLILKCSPDGELLNQMVWGSAAEERAYGVTADVNGSLFLVGVAPTTNGVWNTVKVPWVSRTGTDSEAEGIETIPDAVEGIAEGCVYMLDGAVDIGGGGNTDVLVMKVDPSQWG